MRKIIIMPVVCLLGIILNIILTRFCIFYAGIPLYLDTVFTITVTLSCGLVWGMICGALTNILCHTIFGWGWEPYLFTICNIATAFITWLFYRKFNTELLLNSDNFSVFTLNLPEQKSIQLKKTINLIIILIFLSFTLCIAMSILGGLIATIILSINSTYTEGDGISSILSSTMFSQNVSVLPREILSRIPINIIDRLISVFAGYAAAYFLHRTLKLPVPVREK